MGLPLFVAPAEKGLPAKASGKDGVLAPSRSAIRRQISSARERHNNDTRQAALRALAISPPYLPPALERYHGGSFPWNNSEPSVDPERRSPSLQPPEPPRSVTRDHSLADFRTDGLFDSATFRRIDHSRPEHLDWWPAESQWSTESQPRSRRARVVTPVGSRQPSSHRRLRPRAINSPPPPLPGPSRSLRPARGVDGLGDRDRSLSPEGWDTLQATVTPDPQPPSAGSSFASAAASQMEGPFTSTFRDASANQNENHNQNTDQNENENENENATAEGPDMACESGGEESGTEAPDFEEYHRHMRRRRAELRLRTLRAPNYNLDRILAGDGHRSSRYGSPRESRHPSRLARVWNPQAARTDPLSAGPSGDETETDRSRQAGTEAGAGGGAQQATPPGEVDDWIGLQRVMRSLATREEIPDEMWAEVGLIRSLLRQEETS